MEKETRDKDFGKLSVLHFSQRPELAPSVVTFSVPDLTYPPIRAGAPRERPSDLRLLRRIGGFEALTEQRSEGFIKSFNADKAHGAGTGGGSEGSETGSGEVGQPVSGNLRASAS